MVVELMVDRRIRQTIEPSTLNPLPRRMKRKRSTQRPSQQSQTARLGVDVYSGEQGLSFEALTATENPRNITRAFKLCRAWQRKQWFLGTITELKKSFFNFGFRLKPGDGQDADELKKWQKLNKRWLLHYIGRLWESRLVYSGAITFWRMENDLLVPPFTLRLEQCEYSDAMGLEKLKFTPNWSVGDLDVKDRKGAVLLDPQAKRRYSTTFDVDEAAGEFFSVLKEGDIGDGLDWPEMHRAFRMLNEVESLDVGHSLLAFLSRSPIRQHQVGHEIKNGQHAGSPKHFLKEPLKRAIMQFFKGKVGFMEVVTNFDQKILYVYPDPKLMDPKKFESVINRLMWFAGPVGFMMLARGVAPYLLPMLKQQAIEIRKLVAAHIEHVLSEAWKLEVEVVWSNRCFSDPRIALELMKVGLAAGPISQTSFVEEAGLEPVEELERKKEELKDKTPRLPLYDKDHGQQPGAAPGRKPGSPSPTA